MATETESPEAAKEVLKFTKDMFTALKQVQDQITTNQKQVGNDLGTFMKAEGDLITKGIEFAGPSPRFLAPTWEGGGMPKRESYERHFHRPIIKVLETATASSEEDEIVSDELLENIRAHFLMDGRTKGIFVSQGATREVKKPDQTLIMEWVADSTLELKGLIPSGLQQQLVNYLIKLVLGTGKGTLPSGGNFPTLQGDWWDNDDFWSMKTPAKVQSKNTTSTWLGTFLPVIKAALNVTQSSAKKKVLEVEAKSILKALQNNFNLLPRDPSGQVSDEEVIRSWVRATITGLPAGRPGEITPLQQNMLLAALEDAITNMFPKPDDISFYGTFQSNLIKRILDGPSPSQSNSSEEPLTNSSGSGTNPAAAKGTASKSNPGPDDSSTPAAPVGLKKLIDHATSADNPAIKKQLAAGKISGDALKAVSLALSTASADLEKQLTAAVEASVSGIFLELSEQGTQGRMISTVYDHQLIHRITSYTDTMIGRLQSHFLTDIPNNGSESLEGAKDITAAAVAFRMFAVSLGTVAESFQAEANTGGKTGTAFTRVQNLVTKSPGLDTVADNLYLADTSPEPNIKRAELAAVKLAAVSAGLSSDSKEVLSGSLTEFKSALDTLATNSEALFTSVQQDFATDAKGYFTALSDYAGAKESYDLDETVQTALQDSLEDLGKAIHRGNNELANQNS